jgi:lipid-A-disaccharide synthase
VKYFIIAGEASGDLHAANLIAALEQFDPEGYYAGWGGDRMQNKGLQLLKHYRELDYMGFAEVIKNLPAIYRNFKNCKQQILALRPDAVILVDYPGFNLRIAAWLHKHKIPVFYYISPQVWAWKSSRVKKIKKYVDRMFSILPFEQDFYSQYRYKVDFVGHPLLDAIEDFKRNNKDKTDAMPCLSNDKRPVVALLPGSRKQEVDRMLPVMLELVARFPGFQFVVAEVGSLSPSYYQKFYKDIPVRSLRGDTYKLLSLAQAAAVTSGTASLETALFGLPSVICYKAGWLSYQIAKRLIKIRFIGLANLIMDRMIIPELIQKEMNILSLERELEPLLADTPARRQMKLDLAALQDLLGGPGASTRTARLIFAHLTKTPVE